MPNLTVDSIHIRLATPNDIATLTAFNQAMAWETEGKELAPATIMAGVRGIFAAPERGFYLVAERDAQVVAALMVTTEWSDWRNGNFWWIQSVFVQPEFRRQGIYRRMYDFIKELASQDSQVCGFRLYVEQANHRAQATYTALGMEESPYRLYEELKSPRP